jgi:hypothetical protein
MHFTQRPQREINVQRLMSNVEFEYAICPGSCILAFLWTLGVGHWTLPACRSGDIQSLSEPHKKEEGDKVPFITKSNPSNTQGSLLGPCGFYWECTELTYAHFAS